MIFQDLMKNFSTKLHQQRLACNVTFNIDNIFTILSIWPHKAARKNLKFRLTFKSGRVECQ